MFSGVNSSNFISAAANMLAAQIVEGAMLQLASGLMASFARPLGAGPFAQPSLPSQWQIGAGLQSQPEAPPQAQWTASLGAGGRGTIDLGDGYTLELDERNSEITILNAATGERTRIWGDPHVEQNGVHAFDFWGTTTFVLGNGTKLTINTEQWNGNPNAYVASQLVITRGDQALVVDGISQNQLGDLAITMGQNGRALDAATRDGYTLQEQTGRQTGTDLWLTEMGTVATQRHLDATRVGAEYGPGSAALSLNELNDVLSQFLNFGVLLTLAGAAASDAAAAPAGRR